MKINITRAFTNRKSAKIISILLAILAWGLTVAFFSPDTEMVIRDIPLTINMERTNAQTLGLTVVEGEKQKVSINVKGLRYVVGNLTAEDFTATVSAAPVTAPGEYLLECIVTFKNLSIKNEQSTITNPALRVTLRFDKMESKTFAITALAPEITAASDHIRIEPLSCSPNNVFIQGTMKDLERINKVVVVSNTKQTASDKLQLDGTLELYDENDVKLDNSLFTFDQDKFLITVLIYKTKTVPVKIDFTHTPEGLNIDEIKYTLSEQTIEIAANPEVLQNISEILAGRIDLRTADIGSVFSFEIPLPAGVISVTGVKDVTATISSEGLLSKTFDVKNLSIKNVPEGYEAKLSTKTITKVKIVGKSEIVEALTADDIVGTIDLIDQNVKIGSLSVPASISLPNKGLVWAVGEYPATITVKEK